MNNTEDKLFLEMLHELFTKNVIITDIFTSGEYLHLHISTIDDSYYPNQFRLEILLKDLHLKSKNYIKLSFEKIYYTIVIKHLVRDNEYYIEQSKKLHSELDVYLRILEDNVHVQDKILDIKAAILTNKVKLKRNIWEITECERSLMGVEKEFDNE